MFHSFTNVQIEAISGISGAQQIDVLERSIKAGVPEKNAKRTISSLGFEKLRFIDRNHSMADACIAGALQCLKETNTPSSDVGALVVLTQSPDYTVPATSYTMQDRLNLSHDTIMLDITQGCSGFVYGLFYASNLVQSKVCKKVLLCVGDFSDVDGNALAAQKTNSLLFGEGASVVLLSYSDTQVESTYQIRSYGEKYGVVMNPRSGAQCLRNPDKSKFTSGFQIDGLELANFEIETGSSSIKEILQSKNYSFDDISYAIVHQSNKAILKTIALSLGVDFQKVPFLASQTGNTSSASIPLGITESIQSLADIQNKPTLMCGIGVGLSCACSIVDLKHTKVLPTIYM